MLVVAGIDLSQAWPGALGEEASIVLLHHHPAPVTPQPQKVNRRVHQALGLPRFHRVSIQRTQNIPARLVPAENAKLIPGHGRPLGCGVIQHQALSHHIHQAVRLEFGKEVVTANLLHH